MRTPCEWTISEFVPKVRSELVKALHSRGMNQSEISSILGISQPRVSQYLKEGKNTIIQRKDLEPSKLELLQSQMDNMVSTTTSKILVELLQGKNSAETIPIICHSCRELRMGNALCTLHLHDYKQLGKLIDPQKNCNLCLKWKVEPINSPHSIATLESRMNVLQTLETVANDLLMSLNFLEHIPQIGAQFCLLDIYSDGKNLKDIAAFPGRIIRFQNQAKIVSKPEFLASKSTGDLLLKMHEINAKIVAVLSIKNTNQRYFEELLEEKNFFLLKTIEGDKKGFNFKDFDKKLQDQYNIAIIDSGSVGFESITYLFVTEPQSLIELF